MDFDKIFKVSEWLMQDSKGAQDSSSDSLMSVALQGPEDDGYTWEL